MVLIEIKKIIKDGLIIFLILLALLFAMIATDKEGYLAPVLEIFLLLYASFTGWSIFERERQEGAMEFLLTLPVSRIKLFTLKFLPRLIAVFLVLIVFNIIHGYFAVHFYFSFTGFLFVFITVFLLSVSLSLSMKSFMGTFFISIFLVAGLYAFVKWLDFSLSELNITTKIVFSFVVIPIIFVILFQKFDIKPISYFNKKFIPLVIAVIIVVFGVTYLMNYTLWPFTHLTEDGSSWSVSKKKTVLANEKGEKIIIKESVYPLYEEKGQCYAYIYRGRKAPVDFVRVDLSSGKIKNLYRTEKGWWFHYGVDKRLKLGNRLYFLLTNENHKNYKILELMGDKVSIIPVRVDFGDEKIHMICGGIDSPRQYIVATTDSRPSIVPIYKRVFRIFPSGEGGELFSADAIATWKNRLLVFTDQQMVLYEMGEQPTVIFQKKGKIRKVKRRSSNLIQKKVLIILDNKYQIFDLENTTYELINITRKPFHYYLTAENDFRLIWVGGDEISVSNWKEGRLQVEGVWYITIEDFRIPKIFSSGVVVYNKKRNEIFRFKRDEGGGK